MIDDPRELVRKYPERIFEIGRNIKIPTVLLGRDVGEEPEREPSIDAPEYGSKLSRIYHNGSVEELREFCREHKDVFGEDFEQIESASDEELREVMDYLIDEEKLTGKSFQYNF